MTQRTRGLLLVVLLILLLAGTLMPGELRDAIEAKMRPPPVGSWSDAGHFVLFAAVASVVSASRRNLLRVFAGVFCLAVATEWLQGWVPDRQPHLGDVGIDLAGAMVGMALGSVVWRLRARIQERRARRLTVNP